MSKYIRFEFSLTFEKQSGLWTAYCRSLGLKKKHEYAETAVKLLSEDVESVFSIISTKLKSLISTGALASMLGIQVVEADIATNPYFLQSSVDIKVEDSG